MGGCQNYGPFLGTLNIRGRIIIGTQKGTIILTITLIYSTYSVMVGEKGSLGIPAPWAIPPYNTLSQTWGSCEAASTWRFIVLITYLVIVVITKLYLG